jgi:hypothetical protein
MRQIDYRLEDQLNGLHDTDQFIDRHIPLKTMKMISEILWEILGKREKEKLFKYEENRWLTLHDESLLQTDKRKRMH